ncbi:BBM_1a_G0016500.mRNA.1.CDS.1 [Saccharomyces cerevisiae]|nr:BBM_1a_G0016500.mRNA.1.CDS.1 [Saccharomyces cerevisiae]CAI7106686.1 BBM_1a_G0016500.mRNA.1.CDS.1 [Saccharomyces cerevisiae]
MSGVVSVRDSASGQLNADKKSRGKARNDAAEKDLVSINGGLQQVSSSVSSCNGEKIIKTRGVTRMEVVREKMSTKITWILGLSILLTTWVAALDATTTYNYQPYATSSFNRHSMLSTLTIANSVIGAVCKPFIAKISDLSSRPVTYFVVLLLYVIGFVITACSPTIAAYVIGSVFIAIGQSGISLMNMVIIADTATLKWRSFFTSLLSAPYLVTTWISGYIVEDIINSNWRWGYGMFAIITPVALTPAILVMSYLEHQANKTGDILVGSDPLSKKKVKVTESHISGFKEYWELLKASLIEIAAFGLILLGFAFSLILLPCSLYSYAEGGWNNPSMIAMEVVGGIFLVSYVVFEVFFAPFPLLPKRVLMNRTFICCVIIDFIYQMAGYFSLLFFASYTFVVLNLSYRDWVYLSNTTTMGLCFFGVVWGALFRGFHRYKIFQVVGIAIKLIGMGLYVACSKKDGSPGIGLVVAALIVTNFGDAANVMGTQVAAQAAVPHQDMAATISVLSLYSFIGAAVGTAITSAVWTDKLSGALLKYVPDKDKAVAFFESLISIWEEPWGSANREGAISAYQEVNYTRFCTGLGVSSIMFVVALFQTNYYLGDQQNCVEGEQKEDYHHNANGSKKTLLNRAFDF